VAIPGVEEQGGVGAGKYFLPPETVEGDHDQIFGFALLGGGDEDDLAKKKSNKYSHVQRSGDEIFLSLRVCYGFVSGMMVKYLTDKFAVLLTRSMARPACPATFRI
jgi:hypothetical protein